MAYKEKSPIPIVEGGTNTSSLANTDGVIYFDGTKLATTAVGTATNVLTSNGAGMAPTFQTIPSIGTVTQHDVLIGGAAGAIASLTNGTTGQILSANTGADPSWENVPASSISITGDTGGALTGAAFTFTGSGIGLSFAGSGSTQTLGGTLKLANGGTNANLTASNGGIFYSNASAGAILSGTATADQVLLSGSSTTPAWSTATYPATTTINQLLYSSANNTIGGVTAGDYGVLISSSSGVPSWLANGTTGQVLTATTSGTPSWENAASGGVTGPGSSTTRDIATWNGTGGSALYDNPGVTIDSSGRLKNTNQPCFLAYQGSSVTNVIGDGSTFYTIPYGTVCKADLEIEPELWVQINLEIGDEHQLAEWVRLGWIYEQAYLASPDSSDFRLSSYLVGSSLKKSLKD